MNRRHIPFAVQLTLLVIFFTVTMLNLTAQPRLANPLESGRQIQDIVFRNQMEGYALENDGLWHTTDGGVTWTFVLIPLFHTPLTSIALYEESGLIVGGMSGRLYITDHIKAGWTSTTIRVNQTVTEIEALNRNHWVAMTDSLVLITTDAGATFQQSTPNNNRTFVALDVTNESVMHVLESELTAWRSTDGGTTWHELGTPGLGFGILYDVHFTSPDTGFVASWYPWNLFTTTDGGATWSAGPFEYPTSIAARSGGVAAYTTSEYVRLSNDGGLTWTDSLYYSDYYPFLIFDTQKVVTAGPNTIFLMLSSEDPAGGVVARIDRVSAVHEESRFHPVLLDLW